MALRHFGGSFQQFWETARALAGKGDAGAGTTMEEAEAVIGSIDGVGPTSIEALRAFAADDRQAKLVHRLRALLAMAAPSKPAPVSARSTGATGAARPIGSPTPAAGDAHDDDEVKAEATSQDEAKSVAGDGATAPFTGWHIVVTGTLGLPAWASLGVASRAELLSLAEKRGADVSGLRTRVSPYYFPALFLSMQMNTGTGLTKRTTHLVVCSAGKPSASKVAKARSSGVQIVDEAEFLFLFKPRDEA